MAEKYLTDDLKEPLTALYTTLKQQECWCEDSIRCNFKEVLGKHSLKMKALAQPVRVILTGSDVSPGIFEVMMVLGREKTLKRFEDYLDD